VANPIGTPSIPAAAEGQVPLGTLLVYALPGLILQFTFMLVLVYLMKYATDVLLVPAAVMGLLFGLSRVSDAILDPAAGYLSDRTRSRWGRRRSWMLASSIPMGASFFMLWSPPPGLTDAPLWVWMGVAVFAYHVATTMFAVPHEALGAELSTSYHDRTRIFGVKHIVGAFGGLAALGGMELLRRAEDPRGAAFALALAIGTLLAATTLLAVARLRERAAHQGRGGRNPWRAYGDVWRNPHARLLLLVFGIENFGTAVLAILATYVMQYVYDLAQYTTTFMLLYFVPAILFVPVWIRLSRRFGKRNLWVFSMSMMTVAFGGLAFVRAGDLWLLCALGVIAGIGGGCGQVVGPSIQADVIDYDERATGERKEGIYFAAWAFVRKTAFGIATVLVGFLLSVIGFEPNVEQSDATKLGFRTLFGIVPGLCYLVGTICFLRFRLDEAAHLAIRRELDARA
jgi:GPH family glycoside/pentoside/hexuronide:cation symporter